MQTTNAAFTAEEKDRVRKPAQNLQVSWKKESTLGNRTFTIGVSTIGGDDVIGINPGAIGSPGNYKYFDETDYVMRLAWERSLVFPKGGLSVALAEAELDNTSQRFTPNYLGGSGELFTAILPSRPMIIGAGFEVEGIDYTIPQFSGVMNRPPTVNTRERSVSLSAADYNNFFANRFLDQEIMFTDLRTDQVYEQLLQSMGLATAQYSLEEGLNTIPFGLFERGTQYSQIFNDLAEAENGQFYQDESGIFRFENRHHWNNAPHSTVQKTIFTAQVIDTEAPDFDHVINTVEVKSDLIAEQINQVIYTLAEPITLAPNTTTSFFVDFGDPVTSVDTPTDYNVNTNSDGTSGTDITASVTITKIDKFARAAKIIMSNASASIGYLTELNITGTPVKKTGDLYFREKNGISVTAYDEQLLTIENKYIQDQDWAESYALMILQDYAQPNSIQVLTIRAMPDLQVGDLIAWQGRDRRVLGIRSRYDSSQGFVQDLTTIIQSIRTYFRIGISTIGGPDAIAA